MVKQSLFGVMYLLELMWIRYWIVFVGIGRRNTSTASNVAQLPSPSFVSFLSCIPVYVFWRVRLPSSRKVLPIFHTGPVL
jgi:hypothetical protein